MSILANRGGIGGNVREHVPREPMQRNSKFDLYLGFWFYRREKRDVPIQETRAHNPKVVGSNPVPGQAKACLFSLKTSLPARIRKPTEVLILSITRINSRGNSGETV